MICVEKLYLKNCSFFPKIIQFQCLFQLREGSTKLFLNFFPSTKSIDFFLLFIPQAEIKFDF